MTQEPSEPEQTRPLTLEWKRGNRYGETFKRFIECLKWAKQGKTYIYYHPDFVAIDHKSWEAINKILHPPKKLITYYDEYSDVTPEQEKALNDLFKKRLKADNSVTTAASTDTKPERT